MTTYKIDPMHTFVLWSANHFGFSKRCGLFTLVEGTLTFDEQNPKNSRIKTIIHTAHLITGVTEFDEHLKSEAFFNVEEFPTATFTSEQVTVTGKNTGHVRGALTLLGISKSLILEVTFNKMGVNPINQKQTLGFSATVSIQRSQFGLNFGLPGVSDEVTLNIEAEAYLAD